MIGIGIAWASILSMPYAILAGAINPKKMGVYMGIFNFFIVLTTDTKRYYRRTYGKVYIW